MAIWLLITHPFLALKRLIASQSALAHGALKMCCFIAVKFHTEPLMTSPVGAIAGHAVLSRLLMAGSFFFHYPHV
ncbi:hypothetical protein [Pseudophaeobacter sp.]|uniref:hypothetical protein n=1 Tax=Pseudophaeobacter sp. TaxID=1971739 RepID=UPI0040580533